MTKYTRLTGKVFGSSATASGDDPEIGQFGSALTGEYRGTTDVATIQNLPAWQKGFIGCVTPNTQFPPLPEMTGFGKVLSQQICYLLQQGVAEWDSGTTYYENNWCAYNGSLYISKSDENINNLPTNVTYWDKFTGGSSRNLGEYVTSSLPLNDPTLHLADGSLLSGSNYPELISYIASIYSSSISTDFSPAVQSSRLSAQSGWDNIAYGNGFFLAKCGSYLSKSSDGLTWGQLYQVNDLRDTGHLAFGAGKFVAIGYSTYISSDGENWQGVSGPSTSTINDLIFDGDRFVALEDMGAHIWTSVDGVNWSSITPSIFISSAQKIAYNGSMYIISDGDGYIYTSTDLVNWTSLPLAGPSGINWRSVVLGYDGSTFFALSSTNGYISYTQDGATWTTPTINTNLGNHSWKDYALSGEKLVVIGSNGYISIKGLPLGVFTTEAEWQQTFITYGECGKYVYNAGAGTVRIPLLNRYFKNTVNASDLGDLTPASIPNITGKFAGVGQYYGAGSSQGIVDGAFYRVNTSNNPPDGALVSNSGSGIERDDIFGLDASRISSVYSNRTSTINPQSVKQLVYIVVAK